MAAAGLIPPLRKSGVGERADLRVTRALHGPLAISGRSALADAPGRRIGDERPPAACCFPIPLGVSKYRRVLPVGRVRHWSVIDLYRMVLSSCPLAVSAARSPSLMPFGAGHDSYLRWVVPDPSCPTKKPRTEVRGSFVWLAFASIRSGSSHQRTPYALCRRWSGRCYRYRAADPKRSKPAAGRC